MDVVAMPQLGETVTEGTITSWAVVVGDVVAVDDALFDVSTEKVDTEVPSAVARHVRAILVPAGDTVAVGDQRNDLEMLQWAARGVAMGNAPDEVKAVADEVTLSVTDDGLVPILRSLIP